MIATSKNPHASCRQGEAGFTLVELLVVISIIALLASMVMPAVDTVRAMARQLQCQGNLRQIHLGLQAYANDWDGTMPRVYRSTDTATWGNLISEVMDGAMYGAIDANLGVWRCPMNKAQRFRCDEWMTSEICNSYGGNGLSGSASPWDGRFFGARQLKISHASELIAVLESQSHASEAWYNDGSGCVPISSGLGLRNLRYPHKATTNVLFADGHVAKQKVVLDRGTPLKATSTPVRCGEFTRGRLWWAMD